MQRGGGGLETSGLIRSEKVGGRHHTVIETHFEGDEGWRGGGTAWDKNEWGGGG
jgi:hypothetical protein